jgi:hypothetical protein
MAGRRSLAPLELLLEVALALAARAEDEGAREVLGGDAVVERGE